MSVLQNGMNFILLAGGIFISVVLQCTSPVEEEYSVKESKIRGILYDAYGKRASDASVVMRSCNDYWTGLDIEMLKTRPGQFVCSTTTDDAGRFFFGMSDSIPAGIYTLYCTSDDRKTSVCLDSVKIDSAFLLSDTWLGIDMPRYNTVLKPPGVIKGTLQTAGDSVIPAVVWIAGLDMCVDADHNGNFILDNVPYGNRRLTVAAIERWDSYQQQVEAQLTVKVVAGDTAVADPLYGLIFNGNGATNGTIPINSRLYTAGTQIIIPPKNTGLFNSKAIFDSWNTSEDGDGIIYRAGDTLTFDDAAVMLYAQWKGNGYYALTVTSRGNGMVQGTDRVEHGTPHEITALESAGYPFMVWRVTSGSAEIDDSTAPTTSVILEDGDASIEGIFKTISFRETLAYYRSSGVCVRQTVDDGFIITGGAEMTTSGYNDLRLIKTDAYGHPQWTKMYGGNVDDYGNSVTPTVDGGYIVTGFTLSFDLRISSMYLLKLAADGDTMWTRTFSGEDDAGGHSVEQTSDGGYIVTGYTHDLDAGDAYDVYLVKVRANGDTVWTRTYGSDHLDYGYSVQQTTDDGFIIAGFTQNGGAGTGMYNIYLVKTDADGDTLWTRVFDEKNDDFAFSVQQTNDGGYIVTGGTRTSTANEWDAYLLKTDANGKKVWLKKYDRSDYDMGHSVRQTDDGGYIICGKSGTFKTNVFNICLIKTDANGDTLWTKTFEGNCGYSIEQTRDGGYVLTGRAVEAEDYNILLIKTDQFGNVE